MIGHNEKHFCKELPPVGMSLAGVAEGVADDIGISVDFNAFTGREIKPLHGVNNSPISLNKPLEKSPVRC